MKKYDREILNIFTDGNITAKTYLLVAVCIRVQGFAPFSKVNQFLEVVHICVECFINITWLHAVDCSNHIHAYMYSPKLVKSFMVSICLYMHGKI